MRIAMVQMLSGPDKLANLERVRQLARQAAAEDAELVIFPEATMKAFQTGRLDTEAEALDGAWASAIAELARELGVTIIAGMFTPADRTETKNRVYNTVIVAGHAHAHYHKIHTYDAFGYRESQTVKAGEHIVTFQLDGETIGLATCYDIRFPEQFKALARRGAKLIVVPSSWADGEDKLRQWRVLASARGLDSTSFIAAVGQARPPAEEDRKGPTGIGHSVLISPSGEQLVEGGYDEEILYADVDFAAVDKAREALPVLDYQ